jgi:hypothetical protein
MIRTFGVPGILYSDAHTIFFSPKSGKLSIEEQLNWVIFCDSSTSVLKEIHLPHETDPFAPS